jgi:hypothetical protein
VARSARSGLSGPKPVTKDTLKAIVDVAELAITDEQLGKVAGAMGWARSELKKLRDVETGLIGPALPSCRRCQPRKAVIAMSDPTLAFGTIAELGTRLAGKRSHRSI